METQPRWEFLTYLVCSTGQFRYREGDGVIMVQFLSAVRLCCSSHQLCCATDPTYCNIVRISPLTPRGKNVRECI